MYQNSGRSKGLGIKVNNQWTTSKKLKNSPMVHCTLKCTHHRDDSSATEPIHMWDQKNKQMFITGLRYRNDCHVQPSKQLCCLMCVQWERRLSCLGFKIASRPQCEPPASLSGLVLVTSVRCTADEMNNADSWWRALQKRLFYGMARVRTCLLVSGQQSSE